MVVKSASKKHLMQPVAWRRTNLGLNATACVAEPASMLHERGGRYPCRNLSSATTKSVTPKKVSTRSSLEQNRVPTRPTVTPNHKLHEGHKVSPTNSRVVLADTIRAGMQPPPAKCWSGHGCETGIKLPFHANGCLEVCAPGPKPDYVSPSPREHAPRQREKVSMSQLKFRSHQKLTSKEGCNQPFFEQKKKNIKTNEQMFDCAEIN